MKKADLITGIVLLMLSGYVIQEAWRMPESGTFGPGAGFLPLWVGIILAILAVILFTTAWRRQGIEKDNQSPFPEKRALIAITGVLGGLAVYILLIEVLGYIVDTFLYVTFLMGIVEREKWPRTVMVAAATTAGLFIIFKVILGITLPSNMFGF
jgi:putative tricarboxylic transport membrane protein